MPYIPYTEEEKQLANSVDLTEFLRMRGEKLEKVGREYKLIYYDGSGKHDSIMIHGAAWFDHKNQVGGGAIQFMRYFYGMVSDCHERVAGKKCCSPLPTVRRKRLCRRKR
ncbi:MAG: hypothetical protein ACLR1R_08360 [Ruminococcus callidus]